MRGSDLILAGECFVAPATVAAGPGPNVTGRNIRCIPRGVRIVHISGRRHGIRLSEFADNAFVLAMVKFRICNG